ncbi:SAM and SH3 domain-containing protein 1 isoform X2 [Amia ocellicauda]|uniref:SAM and SH3 domain-containing protein 1 isoform X2 n=1 Tax=Amia ocellicauda TaxID=2972642 RepID=UPI0034645403
MNLFCFSLEGSMDSLYEPVQDPQDTQEYTIPSRPCSPAVFPEETKWRGSERSISMELTQSQNNDLKKKRKTPMPKSISDNGALDSTDCNNAFWASSKNKEDLSNIKNCLNDEIVEDFLLSDFLNGEDRVRLLKDRKAKELGPQVVSYEAWIPNWERSDNRQVQQDMAVDADEEGAESRGTLKRLQRLVRVKRSSLTSPEEGRNTYVTSAHIHDSVFMDDSPVISCIKLTKNPEKKPGKESQAPALGKDSSTDLSWSSSQRAYRPRWSNPTECPPPWDTSYHTCRRPHLEYRVYGYDFTLPRAKDWDKFEYCDHELPHPQFTRSATDVDLCDAKRSSSFGRFDAFRHHSTSPKPDEHAETNPAEGEAGAESCDHNHAKTGSLGKKMRAISLTMRKKMGKKYIKALSEEMIEDADRDHEGETQGGRPLEKSVLKNSESTESLYSLNSGQSSSSGITSGSDGSSNRDSLRLEEEIPYTGPFCGRARVHTDFIPSPYDTDSLKLKIGDVIDIISKPPMGIWTGMLNSKIGNFKFIYVDILMEKEVETRKIRPRRRSKRPRPKTLQELLERIHLEEYTSSLLLNGYQNVEDLKDLKENHLIELNVTDPEHRARLLAATEFLLDLENENDPESGILQEPRSPSDNLKVDQEPLNECPRDSGCYITTECPDTSKDDTEDESQTDLAINVPAQT